ncbi:MAG: L-fucose isomerase [Caldilineae bacterium]|nr:MAG: L-fucose isomerase [Caldilineae bacterium]
MQPPKVGLITFGDNRSHEWEVVFRQLTEPRHRQALAFFRDLPIELHASTAVARHKREIDAQATALQAAGIEALVAHVPCWTSPNLVVRGIQQMGLPTVVLSNRHPGTHGTVGFLGVAGTLDQIGYPHLRVRDDFEGAGAQRIAERILPFCRAAAVRARLRGRVFGLFGGRSLGIDTGTFDPLQWKRLFQVDTEHIDQLEIIRRAELVEEQRAAGMVGWLERMAGRVDYGQGRLTREKLMFQARCYLATRDLIAERGLDFVAIKCMPDLTNFYVPQCLTAALLPGPYDSEGEREPVMMACEADADAALTMEILKLVSGGKPVLFMDVSYIDDEAGVFYMPNCGAFCSWYAARSDDPAENLRHVQLRPANRPGGGAITYFHTAPGPLTFARLFRRQGVYHMSIIQGETTQVSEEKLRAFVAARGSHQLPTAFARLEVDIDAFLAGFASNHILAVDGQYLPELLHLCDMLGIRPETYTPGHLA